MDAKSLPFAAPDFDRIAAHPIDAPVRGRIPKRNFSRLESFGMETQTALTSAASSRRDDVVATGQFDPTVVKYWVALGAFSVAVTIIFVPLLPFFLLIAFPLADRYLQSHHLELAHRELRLRKGLFTKIEKTIPLEKITDVGYIQGPLMRFFGVEGLTVETAGQSAAGALINLQGVRDARGFRDLVLKQRDLVGHPETSGDEASPRTPSVSSEKEILETLRSIDATLQRIESRFGNDA